MKFLIFIGKCKQIVVAVIVAVNRNINGIVYWLMIRTMIVVVFLWIGFCFHRVACVVVVLKLFVFCNVFVYTFHQDHFCHRIRFIVDYYEYMTNNNLVNSLKNKRKIVTIVRPYATSNYFN